jgi:dihydromethanopterin reductase
VAEIRAMCAIGQRGQLGLNGRLPWEGNKGREYVDDVARFFARTRGHVIIAGPTTVASIPAFAYEERTICEIRSDNDPAEVLAQFPDRVIYVGGGPPVWTAYAPFIQHWDITRLPYDGEADRWFDSAWLVAAPRQSPANEPAPRLARGFLCPGGLAAILLCNFVMIVRSVRFAIGGRKVRDQD